MNYIVRELYDAFQQGEFDRWDALVAENVLINSTMGRGIQGREALKGWASQYELHPSRYAELGVSVASPRQVAASIHSAFAL